MPCSVSVHMPLGHPTEERNVSVGQTGPFVRAGSHSPNWSMLACCFNPRVLIVAAVVIGGVALLDRSLLLAALPFALYLICPISMLLMVWSMNRK